MGKRQPFMVRLDTDAFRGPETESWVLVAVTWNGETSQEIESADFFWPRPMSRINWVQPFLILHSPTWVTAKFLLYTCCKLFAKPLFPGHGIGKPNPSPYVTKIPPISLTKALNRVWNLHVGVFSFSQFFKTDGFSDSLLFCSRWFSNWKIWNLTSNFQGENLKVQGILPLFGEGEV